MLKVRVDASILVLGSALTFRLADLVAERQGAAAGRDEEVQGLRCCSTHSERCEHALVHGLLSNPWYHLQI